MLSSGTASPGCRSTELRAGRSRVRASPCACRLWLWVRANARACLDAGVNVVIGTTGFDLDELRRAAEAARAEGSAANAFVAPNFAIGAVLMMRFAAEAARHMPEVEIVELHHDRKLDAPSGTAKRTAELIARRAATSTSRSTRCACRASSPTRRCCSAARARRSRSATTRSTAARSCPACCSRCGASASCPSRSRSGSSTLL